jgi:hypothetical protein
MTNFCATVIAIYSEIEKSKQKIKQTKYYKKTFQMIISIVRTKTTYSTKIGSILPILLNNRIYQTASVTADLPARK